MDANPLRWPPLPAQPLVTIVTPSFNQGHFIEETIRSVLEQDYPHLEYLVMDGGSTDGTLEVLRRYEDRLLWSSGPDGGQAAAINHGWRRGRGEILAWLNSDDTYLPGAVSAAVAWLQAHPEASGVYGDCDYVDEHGRVIDHHHTASFDFTALVRTARAPIPQPATFVRRAAVEAAGYLDTALTMVLDFDLWLRLGAVAPLGYLPRRLARFREHATSKTVARQAQAAAEILRVYRRFFARTNLPPAIRAIETQAMANALILAGNSKLMAGQLESARHYALAGMWRATLSGRLMALKILLIGALGRPGLATYLRARHRLRSMLLARSRA